MKLGFNFGFGPTGQQGSAPAPSAGFLLLADGSSKLFLADSSSYLLKA